MKENINLFEDKNWEEAKNYPSGTKRKVLREDENGRTILLKLPQNFYMPPHSHVVTEQNFVLEGEYISNGKMFSKGSYQMFLPHDEHGPFESKNGALILVVWDKLNPL